MQSCLLAEVGIHLSYLKSKVLHTASFSQSSCCMSNKVRGFIVSFKSRGSNKNVFSVIKDNLVYSKGTNSVSANWPCETMLLMLLQASCYMQTSIIITVENRHRPFRIMYEEQQFKYHLPNLINSKYYSKEVCLNLFCRAHRSSAAASCFYPQSPPHYCFLAFGLRSSVVPVKSWHLLSLGTLLPWQQGGVSDLLALFHLLTTIIQAL